jgi:hypothetical protein
MPEDFMGLSGMLCQTLLHQTQRESASDDDVRESESYLQYHDAHRHQSNRDLLNCDPYTTETFVRGM